jgi:hypothetical protein
VFGLKHFMSGAVLLAAFGATPAAAGSYPFTLHNFTSSDVTGVTVKNGEVKGFKRVLAKKSLTFTVVFPDGQCRTPRVRVKFAKGGFTDHPNYDVCSGDGITVVGP